VYELLDGRSDKPSEKADSSDVSKFRAKERFVSNPENKLIFNIKKEALTLIDLIFNYRSSSLLNALMLDFKRMQTASEKRGYFPSLFCFPPLLSFLFSFFFASQSYLSKPSHFPNPLLSLFSFFLFSS